MKEEVDDYCADVDDGYKCEPCDTTNYNMNAQYETAENGTVELECMEDEKKFIQDSSSERVMEGYKESGQVSSMRSTEVLHRKPLSIIRHVTRGSTEPTNHQIM